MKGFMGGIPFYSQSVSISSSVVTIEEGEEACAYVFADCDFWIQKLVVPEEIVELVSFVLWGVAWGDMKTHTMFVRKGEKIAVHFAKVNPTSKKHGFVFIIHGERRIEFNGGKWEIPS
jgi:hypothetical protein